MLDITDAAAVADLPAQVLDGFGPIDVLVNNAGHDIGGDYASEDIAHAIMFALTQPAHVQVAQMVVLPINRW